MTDGEPEAKEGIFDQILNKINGTGRLDALAGIPNTEWQHRDSLLRPELKGITELNKILTKELALGNIRDDLYVKIVNERMGLCVIPLFQTAWRCHEASEISGNKDWEAVDELANWIFGRTIIDIRTTRSKNGFERILQAGGLNRDAADAMRKEGGFALPKAKKDENSFMPEGGGGYE